MKFETGPCHTQQETYDGGIGTSPRAGRAPATDCHFCVTQRCGRGSEDAGTMLLIRMYVTRFP
jgi:hypothetical protein